jgi:acetyl esterase
LIIAAACDPLVDDVMLYAKRLRAEGVDTRLMEYPGVVHGFYSSPHAIDLATDANDEVAAHLRATLHAPGP